ncbi:MAG: photosynthetic complex putative assembly protein PuhB [Pseudomonadota bacterium]
MVGYVAPDYDNEPVPGLPGPLPQGEHIVWQGSPVARRIANQVLKLRWIVGYFAVLTAWLLVSGVYLGRTVESIIISMLIMMLAGALVSGFLWLIARSVARSTIYTITNRRIVMRYGIVLPTAFNLPYSEFESVNARVRPDGSGDIALRFRDDVRLAWLIFWPHVRGFRMARTEPQLTGLDNADAAAEHLKTQLSVHLARHHQREPEPVGSTINVETQLPVAAE